MTVYDDAALAAARRYCGWPVTPPIEVTVTLNGPGGVVLLLPTMNIVELTSVTEDGAELDLDDLIVDTAGLIRKRSGACWSHRYGSIVVTMEHGYAEAPDFTIAVSQASVALQNLTSRGDPALTMKRVDDVEYQWSVTLLREGALNTSLLNPFRIIPVG